jgi:hypothetical protein
VQQSLFRSLSFSLRFFLYAGSRTKIVGDHPSWSEIVGINYIAFYIPNGESDSSFTLFFEDCAMGEYQRIKRIIDEKTWR